MRICLTESLEVRSAKHCLWFSLTGFLWSLVFELQWSTDAFIDLNFRWVFELRKHPSRSTFWWLHFSLFMTSLNCLYHWHQVVWFVEDFWLLLNYTAPSQASSIAWPTNLSNFAFSTPFLPISWPHALDLWLVDSASMRYLSSSEIHSIWANLISFN